MRINYNNISELLDAIKNLDIKMIDLRFIDIPGTEQHFTIPINYLNEDGNPYNFIGVDKEGKLGLEFGVIGLPETFIINNEGKIIYKHLGPLSKKIIEDEIKPFLQ